MRRIVPALCAVAMLTAFTGPARAATPLHAAAFFNNNPAVIEALIAGGADMKARTKGGKTPFHYAKDNKALWGTDVYWRLNEARFE